MVYRGEDLENLEDEQLQRTKRTKNDIFLRNAALWTLFLWGLVVFLKTLGFMIHEGDINTANWHWPLPSLKPQLNKISFENVRNSTFTPKLHSVQWIGGFNSSDHDKGLFLREEVDSYVVKSVFDEKYSRVLLSDKTFDYEGHNYSVEFIKASPDLKQILVRSNTTKNWRHSTFGTYFLFDVTENAFRILGHNIAKAQWSPNSIDVAYVHANDLYLYSSKTHTVSKRVTDDGSPQVFNGKPDWVYEEEVFEGDSAMWWSPSGDFIAFLKINETQVHEFPIPYFSQQEEDIYPEVRKIKYPKSGSPNPSVQLMIYNLELQEISGINAGNESTLITEVLWVGDSQVLAKTTDRSSDVLSVVIADAKRQGAHQIPRTESSGDGWWEITHNTMYVSQDSSKGRKQDGYVDLVPLNGYNHLAYFSPADTTKPIMLTDGDWEVVNGPTAIDFETNDVYFIGTKKSSMERHIYSVNLHEPLKVKEITDTTEEGYFSVSFSSGCRFALVSHLGPEVPYQKIIDLKSDQHDTSTNGNVIGKTLFYLEENKVLKARLEDYSIPQKTFSELRLGEDENGEDIVANSFEILPNNFNPKLKNHYPVFFYAYGGPNSQQVAEIFSIGFNQVVASQLNAIVVVVDGRGTGFKGKRFRALVRNNLGDVEAQDQILAAKLYAEKPYVDANKISLFGWSYGGYLTLKTLEKDAGRTFKYGMSVAPVTDWRLYDSVYTERYMHTPQQNRDGYARSKVHNATALGEATRFLLMHGSGDDNVHFQNSLRFLDLLDLAGVENYDMHVFPDSDHSIRYHNANNIVFDKLLNWAGQAYEGRFLN
ncbi:LANO_0H09802g1_1 [Lachancea nothofagi CBS 11611]|uniref:LANO_0H09802g1_1 n=1 Tax=Lachancea nothofagi CBS 11611 TaxID=1266666 RepID=A0A1G4KLT5_9SACH|nr:LANO_0H09802g1_1 [Lachancea nothofagi CBS 11611]